MALSISYFSRSGRSRALALELAEASGASVTEIRCSRYRGVLGRVRAVWDMWAGFLPEIEVSAPIGAADWLIVVGPVWHRRLALPPQRFLQAAPHLPPICGVAVTRDRVGLMTHVLEAAEAARPSCPPAVLAVAGRRRVERHEILGFLARIKEIQGTSVTPQAA